MFGAPCGQPFVCPHCITMGLSALGGVLLFYWAPMKIAVQLYTLRNLLQNDTYTTLRRLTDIGFKTAELAGTYGKPPEEFATKCREFGLKIISPHLGIDQFEQHPDDVKKLCDTMGTDMAVLPHVGKDVYGDGWDKAAKRFNKIGAAMKDRGIRFFYHNHSFEFEKIGDTTGYDILWDNADPALVWCEMDLYWVKYGGGDPVHYLKKLKGRVKNTHFKDMAATEDRRFEDVGYGILDWKTIIPTAISEGVDYAIIEQDDPPGDPLEHVARSRDYLISQGLSD